MWEEYYFSSCSLSWWVSGCLLCSSQARLRITGISWMLDGLCCNISCLPPPWRSTRTPRAGQSPLLESFATLGADGWVLLNHHLCIATCLPSRKPSLLPQLMIVEEPSPLLYSPLGGKSRFRGNNFFQRYAASLAWTPGAHSCREVGLPGLRGALLASDRALVLRPGSHGGSHTNVQLRHAVDVDGCWGRPDLRQCMELDASGHRPDVLLIRGFRVRSPGGPPILTCMFVTFQDLRRRSRGPLW